MLGQVYMWGRGSGGEAIGQTTCVRLTAIYESIWTPLRWPYTIDSNRVMVDGLVPDCFADTAIYILVHIGRYSLSNWTYNFSDIR